MNEQGSTTAGPGVLANDPSQDAVTNMPAKPKFWNELTDAEKIERTRREVKSLKHTVEYIGNEFNRLANNFYSHKHDCQNGELIKRLERYGDSLGGFADKLSPIDPDKVYF